MSRKTYNYFVKKAVKHEASRGRRNAERQALSKVLKSPEPDPDVVLPTKNEHVSDRWNWD